MVFSIEHFMLLEFVLCEVCYHTVVFSSYSPPQIPYVCFCLPPLSFVFARLDWVFYTRITIFFLPLPVSLSLALLCFYFCLFVGWLESFVSLKYFCFTSKVSSRWFCSIKKPDILPHSSVFVWCKRIHTGNELTIRGFYLFVGFRTHHSPGERCVNRESLGGKETNNEDTYSEGCHHRSQTLHNKLFSCFFDFKSSST